MAGKKIDSKVWTGEIPQSRGPYKFENTPEGMAYYADRQRRKKGDLGFELKHNIISLIVGVGFLAGAYLMAQVIDLKDNVGRYPASTPIFLFVMGAVVAAVAPLLNALRYWRKTTGKPPISALEHDGDYPRPIVEGGIIVLLLTVTVAVTGRLIGFW